ncbi:MAG: SGNH/GDSL hydrolase family protein [Pseudomonadota bacterium]
MIKFISKMRFTHRQIAGLLILILVNHAVQAQTFSRVVSFGDSLSDTGNLASALINFPPPYYQNRISDGPVAIDYLAAAVGGNAIASEVGGDNFAVAGGNILGNEREDLSRQITDYLARVNQNADPEALFFIMVGGNDLRGLRGQTSNAIAQITINQTVNALVAQLQRLSAAGAKHFFITNVANVGRIPETLQQEAEDPGISARAQAYVQIYNQRLNSRLLTFAQQTGANVIDYDLFSEFEKLLNSPASFGFTQSTVGCFDINEIEDLGDIFNIANGVFHPDCLLGTRFDRFVFFDNLHPSSRSNELIGNSMIARLAESNSARNGNIIGAILLLLLDD